MTARLIEKPEKDPKAGRKSKPYDGYAIFCDKDRAKIRNLLRVLKHLNLCIRCKDDAISGQGIFEAIVENGILASRCCLIFVSSAFKNDHLCVHFTKIAILQYLRTDRKLRIIPICLDRTKITCLQIFQEISLYKSSIGTVPEVVPGEKLISAIYKAMKTKGSREKSIFTSCKGCHYRLHCSCKKKRKKLFLKNIKISKFVRLKCILTRGDCLYQKLLKLSRLIYKCLFDSHKWRKLVKLITSPQILCIIKHYFTTNLECHLHQYVKIEPSVHNVDERPVHEIYNQCRFCCNMVLRSKLAEHEEECQMPINCETCNRLIAKALKQQHESRCILEECSICNEYHSPSHDCSSANSQATVLFEDLDSISQNEFPSLNSVAAQKCTELSDMKKTINELLNVVSSLKMKKKKSANNSNNFTDLLSQLILQLNAHKIIDENTTDAIYQTVERNMESVGFSENSMDYFRYFVVAIELHCNRISLFDFDSTLVDVMCNTPPPPKKGFFHRFQRKKTKKESEQVFFPLVQNLFTM